MSFDVLEKLVIISARLKTRSGNIFHIPSYWDILEHTRNENEVINYVKAVQVFEVDLYLDGKPSFTKEWEFTIATVPQGILDYLENKHLLRRD